MKSNACFLHYKFNKKFITRILDLSLMFYSISCYCVSFVFFFNKTQYWMLKGTQLSYQTKCSLRMKIHRNFQNIYFSLDTKDWQNSIYSYQGNFHLFYDFPLPTTHQTRSSCSNHSTFRPLITVEWEEANTRQFPNALLV